MTDHGTGGTSPPVASGEGAGGSRLTAQGLTAGVNGGPLDDPDFDRIASLLEFVLLNPETNPNHALPANWAAGSTLGGTPGGAN